MATASFAAVSQASSLRINAGLASTSSSSLNASSQASFTGPASLNFSQRGVPTKRRQAFRVRAEQEVEEKAAPMSTPATRAFTGYVEKDTAGQTNIYAVEPTLYVAESAFSTNSGGSSADGSSGTLIISGFLAVAAVSGAAGVLFTVNSSQPAAVEERYTGPPLDYYVQKFKNPDSVPSAFVDASLAAPELQAPAVVESALEPEVPEVGEASFEAALEPEAPQVVEAAVEAALEPEVLEVVEVVVEAALEPEAPYVVEAAPGE